jgi:hypothetical protein
VAGCSLQQPEVVVVNRTAEQILVVDPSFNGTKWSGILRYGQATPPRRCMRGSDRVHFKKYDAAWYCRQQVEHGMIDSLCMCDSAWASPDTDLIDQTPLLFNYQTNREHDAEYGNFYVIEITVDDMDQDFSIPGPYGH